MLAPKPCALRAKGYTTQRLHIDRSDGRSQDLQTFWRSTAFSDRLAP